MAARNWKRTEDGYVLDEARIYDNGAGVGPARGSGRWAVEVGGKWIANVDTLAEAKRVAVPNPVVRETPLRAYPGWVVREYLDGLFDATNGKALSPGFRSFADVIGHVRAEADEARKEARS